MYVQKFQNCINACLACIIECNHCANECLKEDAVKKLIHCIKRDRDCVAVCLLAIDAMARESEFVKQICELCAMICSNCAEECEKHSHMEHCKKCAEACKTCASECTNMSKHIQ